MGGQPLFWEKHSIGFCLLAIGATTIAAASRLASDAAALDSFRS
jgi:hypothetical protein